MNLFNIIAILIVISALFAYIKFRFIKLPSVIGVMLISVLVSLALGAATYWLLKSVDNYQVEILLTLALVTGGYALAVALGTSGPITIVVAGLLIGNQGRQFAMSDQTRERLTLFWELVDEILNSILFVLIGIELLAVTFARKYIVAGAAAIPVALASRFASLGLPAFLFRLGGLPGGALKIITWEGCGEGSPWPLPCLCLQVRTGI